MKKKILSALLCVAMVASFAVGCGDKPATAPAETTAAGTEAGTEAAAPATEAQEAASSAAAAVSGDFADKKVGICIYKFDDNFMTLFREELVNYLVSLGFSESNITVVDSKNDQAEQTNQINNFITQKVDVLIVNLVNSSAAATVTDTINASGIPVVYINREPESAEEDRWVQEGIKATYVGADARQSGTFQGEVLLDLGKDVVDINGDGKIQYIMIQGDPENIDAKYRTEYSVKALTDAGWEVELLGAVQRADWDQATAQQKVQDALSQYGEKIEVIFCNNDAMALGAKQALDAAGRKVGEDVFLLGVDALTEALELVQSGGMTATVFNDHVGQSHTAAEAAVAFINGEEVPNTHVVDYVKVTADNAADILSVLQ